MKTLPIVVIVAAVLAPPVYAQVETVVAPKVDTVSLFKNGLALVETSFAVPKDGLFVWERPPTAVHGTFWVESDAKLSVRSVTRMLPMLDGTPNPSGGGLQEELAGASVIARFKQVPGGGAGELRGRVVAAEANKPPRHWATDYASLRGDDSWRYARYGGYVDGNWRGYPGAGMGSVPGFLALETADGSRRYVALDTVSEVEVKGAIPPRKHEQVAPVLVFEARNAPAQGGTARILYLTKGMAWAPSYRFDATGKDRVSVRKTAVIRNELLDLRDTQVRLISGFPNVAFGNVDSPLWAHGTLAGFFAQLANRGGSGRAGVESQMMVTSNSMAPQGMAPVPELKDAGGDGVDLHFEDIGKHSLAAGESISLEIGSAQTNCEHVVEWVAKDMRDRDGRTRSREEQERKDENQPWDAIRFKNPFPAPMTTGPAMAFRDGRFQSQSTSYWANPAGATSLRTTKALSVRAESEERELGAERQSLDIRGRSYERKKIAGLLRVKNFRGEPVTMHARAELAGEFISAEGEPEKRLRAEEVASLNPLLELEWRIVLAPKEEKTVHYSYSVLVAR